MVSASRVAAVSSADRAGGYPVVSACGGALREIHVPTIACSSYHLSSLDRRVIFGWVSHIHTAGSF